MAEIKNKRTVLLIGASGGLGLQIANSLGDANYNLALHYYENKQQLKSLAKSIGKIANAELYYADITNENSVMQMIKDVEKDFGCVDILINNAGVSLDSITWKTTLESWNKSIAVNLTGPFLCIKHVLPQMRKNNFGRIISMSSVVAQTGMAGTVAYAASKAGLTGMTKTIAKEAAKNNITVNQISLGYFNTGMINKIEPAGQKELLEAIPKNYFGNAEDIVSCLLYLCSENASYITGQNININGGLY